MLVVGLSFLSLELVFVLDLDILESREVRAVVGTSLVGPEEGPLEVVLLLLLESDAFRTCVSDPDDTTGSHSGLLKEWMDGLDLGL